MGNRKFPPLTPKQVLRILEAHNFVFVRSRGDHRFYSATIKGMVRLAQIDWGADMVEKDNLQMTIDETGLTREEFYCSTKEAAKKINMQVIKPKRATN